MKELKNTKFLGDSNGLTEKGAILDGFLDRGVSSVKYKISQIKTSISCASERIKKDQEELVALEETLALYKEIQKDFGFTTED